MILQIIYRLSTAGHFQLENIKGVNKIRQVKYRLYNC